MSRDFYVRYHDGHRTIPMSRAVAKSYANIFGGTVYRDAERPAHWPIYFFFSALALIAAWGAIVQ